MPRLVVVLGLGLAVALALAWLLGAFDLVTRWAAAWQRDFQTGLARALRALRAGEPGAVAALLTGSFLYGLVHAAGPGHGKVLIGGYGVARRVPALRLAGIALASSLAQALTAIVLVYAAIGLFSFGRGEAERAVEHWMAPASYAAIALIGLWLIWRGLRGLWRVGKTQGHAHEGAGAQCETCGHAHGPTPDQVAEVRSLRDALMLIGGIALRPCTGALFLLILTWRFGFPWIGVAGAVSMALGTAAITIAVALGAVLMREGALTSAAGKLRVAAPVLEFAAGIFVAAAAVALLMRAV